MSNLKHLFLPYTLAVTLKEKGFNEPCLMHYYKDFCKGELFNEMENPFSNQLHTIKNSDGELIGAPIYQQAIEWFEKKHNHIIYRNIDIYDSYCYNINKGKLQISVRDSVKSKALNKALKEALKLI